MTKILFVCHGNICRFYILLALQGIQALEQGVSLLRNGKHKTVWSHLIILHLALGDLHTLFQELCVGMIFS